MENTPRTVSRAWAFLVGWVLANLFGIILGEMFAYGLAYFGSGGFGAPVADPEPTNLVTLFFIGLMLGVPPGALLGGFQSLSIEPYLQTKGKWFWMTMIGFTLSVFLIQIGGSFLERPLDMEFWFWISLSLLLGVLQLALLRKRIKLPGAVLWIFANIVQGSIAGILGANWILEGALYWGIGSITTGLVLAWQLSFHAIPLEQQA